MTAYRHPHDLIREWTERQEAVRRAYHGDRTPDQLDRERAKAERHAASVRANRKAKKA